MTTAMLKLTCMLIVTGALLGTPIVAGASPAKATETQRPATERRDGRREMSPAQKAPATKPATTARASRREMSPAQKAATRR
jgi:hypothetical protein